MMIEKQLKKRLKVLEIERKQYLKDTRKHLASKDYVDAAETLDFVVQITHEVNILNQIIVEGEPGA